MALSEITNYIEDDWDDNALTNRTGSEEGYYLHPSDNLISDFEAGSALKGVYRPEWTTANGSPSSSNGFMILPDGSTTVQRVKTTSKASIGSWSVDYRLQSSTSSGQLYLSLRDTSGSELYRVSGYNSFEDEVQIYDAVDTIFILRSSITPNETSFHTLETTRDAYGNFELFYDGISQGTVNDTTSTTFQQLWVVSGIPTTAEVDNLVVQ